MDSGFFQRIPIGASHRSKMNRAARWAEAIQEPGTGGVATGPGHMH